MKSAEYRRCAKCHEGRMILQKTAHGRRFFECSVCEIQATGEPKGDVERLRYADWCLEGRTRSYVPD
jgi:ssDNA-binding Zn-finger/Zn-ribbon topoisomerase 1